MMRTALFYAVILQLLCAVTAQTSSSVLEAKSNVVTINGTGISRASAENQVKKVVLRNGYSCGSIIWKDGKAKNVPDTKSVFACKTMCLEDEKCEGIDYSVGSMRCVILRYNPRDEMKPVTGEYKENKYCGRAEYISVTMPTPSPTSISGKEKVLGQRKGFTCGTIDWSKSRNSKKETPFLCKQSCLELDTCRGFQYFEGGKTCNLLLYNPLNMMKPATEKYYCGAATYISPPTASPTVPTSGLLKYLTYRTGFRCGQINWSVVTTVSRGDVIKCKNACFYNQKCRGFQYYDVSKKCYLLPYDPTDMMKPAENTWKKNKYHCGAASFVTPPTVSPTDAPARDYRWKDNTKCRDIIWSQAAIVLDIKTPQECEGLCGRDYSLTGKLCLGFQHKAKLQTCVKLYYRPVIQNIDEMDSGVVCGKALKKGETFSPTVGLTQSTAPTVSPFKNFAWDYNTRCEGGVDWKEADVLGDIPTLDACISIASRNAKCRGFYFNSGIQRCAILFYKPLKVLKLEEPITMEVCGKVLPQGVTNAPNKLPPTKAPSTTPDITKDYKWKENTRCTEDIDMDQAITIVDIQTPKDCALECDPLPKCKGFYFTSDTNQCILLKYRTFTIEDIVSPEHVEVCAKVNISRPDPEPTLPPIPASPAKDYRWKLNTKCRDDIDTENAILLEGVTSPFLCSRQCDAVNKCKGFYFTSETNDCILLKYKQFVIVDIDPESDYKVICAKVKE